MPVSERNDFTGDQRRLDELRKERKKIEAEMAAEEKAIEEQKRLKRAIQKEKRLIKEAEKRRMTAASYNSFFNKTKRNLVALQKQAKRIHKEIKKR